MSHALFIIAPENFQDHELADSQQVLTDAGVETTIASTEIGECHGGLGGTATAVIGLNQINAEDFDAIIFVGGGGSQIFCDDQAAHLIAQKAIAADKILAAICAAPTILARAGVLRGKNATVFASPDYEQILDECGATRTKNPVEVDGKIVTANGPAAATAFGEQILELLKNDPKLSNSSTH